MIAITRYAKKCSSKCRSSYNITQNFGRGKEGGSKPKLPNHISDESGDLKGFDLVKHRAITMLTNISDGQMVKVLHVFAGGDIYQLLGNKTNFCIDGCSDEISDVEVCKSLKQYAASALFDPTKPLNYNSGAFQFVLCLYPVLRDPTLPLLDPHEIFRLVNDGGFACIGMRNNVVDMDKAIDLLNSEVYKEKEIHLMTMQRIKLVENDFRVNGSSYSKILNISQVNEAIAKIHEGEEKYWVALLRRGINPRFK